MSDYKSTDQLALMREIYKYVERNYGESEAKDPSWAIEPLADFLSQTFVTKNSEQIEEEALEMGELENGDLVHVSEIAGVYLVQFCRPDEFAPYHLAYFMYMPEIDELEDYSKENLGG